VLSLAYNQVVICSQLTMLSDLHTLNVQHNAIVSMDEVGYLGLCMGLVHLTLVGNPIQTDCVGGDATYRSNVMEAVSQLESLDAKLEPQPPIIDDVESLVSNEAGEGRVRLGTAGEGGRPGSATGSGGRPGTAGSGGRPGTAAASARPGTASRRRTSSNSGEASKAADTTLFQGNAIKALRARKAAAPPEEDPDDLDALLASVGLGPADEYVTDDVDTTRIAPSPDIDTVFSDLRSWHSNYSRQSAAIEMSTMDSASGGGGAAKPVVARVSMAGNSADSTAAGRQTNKKSSDGGGRSGGGGGGGRPPVAGAAAASPARPPKGRGPSGARSRSSSSSGGGDVGGAGAGADGVAATPPRAARPPNGASPRRAPPNTKPSPSGGMRPTPPRGSGPTPPRGSRPPPMHSPKPPSDEDTVRRSRTASGLRRQRLRSVDATAPPTPPQLNRPDLRRPFSGPADLPPDHPPPLQDKLNPF
jgi:hypothetical protein